MTKKKTKSQSKKQNDDWFGTDKLKPPGRPPKDIDFATLDKLLALQVTRDEAAAWFNVSHDTLERRIYDRTGLSFASYREQKGGMGRINLRRKQYQVAMSGNVAMLIWLGKQWLKQSERVEVEPAQPTEPLTLNAPMTFEQFCVNAGYPAPFPKQTEMKDFGIENEGARLILGSRGYGKTDYVVILGIAYKLYTDRSFRALLITKSQERNAAILGEIAAACEKAGMVFEINNSKSIRVQGLLGKDHSVSGVTIKSVTLRGRHPDVVVMDDPVTPDDTSDATRRQVKKVYNELNKLTDNVLIIGQPVHKFDLYQELRPKLKNKMEVPHGTIPELDHDLEAQRLAGVDEASIQASYFLKILSEGSMPFENIKYIDRFPKASAAVAFIDPAFGGQDYTAVTILKAWMDGVACIGWVWRKSWEHCLDEMATHFAQYNVKRCAFETNKTGDQPLDILRKALKVGCVGVFSNTNKHSRIMAAGTYAHMIHLSKQSHPEYIKQVVQYEHDAKHDDAPDSLASGLGWLGLIRGKQ